MHQDRDEPVRTFAARARGQARTCKFTQDCPQCSTAVDFTDTMIRDVVTRGLDDQEIQQDLLGDRNQEPCLEEVIQFVESKESGKRSAKRLLDSHAVGAISRYNRSKKDEIKANNSTQFARRAAAINRPTSDPHEPCHYCGKRGHGKRALPQVRAAEGPAYGHACKHCHKRDHFESVCRSRSARREDSKDNTEAAFQSLCAVTEHFSPLYSVTILVQNPGRRAIALDHHIYDQLSKMWLRRSSEPQPYTMLTVTPIGEDYADLGFPLKSRTRSSILPSMADTGCQSCLGGMKLLPRLGMTADDLIPVSMKMHAANGKGINILGAAILRFSGKSPNGEPRETRQITYITDNSDKLFLSREACIALGIITTMFPTVGEVTSPSCPQISCAGTRMRQILTHTRVAAHGDRNHPLCQPNFLLLHKGKTDQNYRNIYWTTTHRARSTPADISCYP